MHVKNLNKGLSRQNWLGTRTVWQPADKKTLVVHSLQILCYRLFPTKVCGSPGRKPCWSRPSEHCCERRRNGQVYCCEPPLKGVRPQWAVRLSVLCMLQRDKGAAAFCFKPSDHFSAAASSCSAEPFPTQLSWDLQLLRLFSSLWKHLGSDKPGSEGHEGAAGRI